MSFKKIKYFALTKSYGQYINLLSLSSAVKASQKAFELFSQPRKGKLTLDKIPSALLQPNYETFIFQDNQYQVYVWPGNEEIILLIHGWESNSSRWKKLLPYLIETGKTIVALDAPAHIFSTGIEFTVPKYANVIAELTKKYNPNYIIGHSIGAAAIIYYQYVNQNTNIDKIVLMGAPSDLQILIDNFCNMLSLNNKVKAELEKRFEAKVGMKVSQFSGMKFAEKVDTKTLLIHDKNDEVVFIGEGKKMAKTFKNVEFIETENLGHGLHSKKIYQKIINFLLES
ncbi:MAG: alpha/beta fold hydrolase [Flavobacterium sp.]|nr:alpha/beta fold hydrolase [Flavobacterium sp.]